MRMETLRPLPMAFRGPSYPMCPIQSKASQRMTLFLLCFQSTDHKLKCRLLPMQSRGLCKRHFLLWPLKSSTQISCRSLDRRNTPSWIIPRQLRHTQVRLPLLMWHGMETLTSLWAHLLRGRPRAIPGMLCNPMYKALESFGMAMHSSQHARPRRHS